MSDEQETKGVKKQENSKGYGTVETCTSMESDKKPFKGQQKK